MTTPDHKYILTIPLLLLFWAITTTNLDRFPTIHNDETAILAPGHKLMTEGVYGLDMYAGFHEREEMYLEVMPLMSWLQGVSSWFLGIGVWPMRFLPALAGLFTLALTYAFGQALVSRLSGFLGMALWLFWQWAPGGDAFFGSGMALVDLSRLARYDILIAPLSLLVLLSWWRAGKTGQRRYEIAAGFFIGLAGLTQLYGLFWLPAIGLFWLVRQPRKFRSLLLVGGAAAAPLSIWLVMVLTHWAQFQQQFGIHESRFALTDFSFYLSNLLREGERYFLGFSEAGTFTRLGFWLVVVGLPVMLVWLSGRFIRHRQIAALYLLLPSLLFPILFALFIQKKQFSYLLLVMPCFIIGLAWLFSDQLKAATRFRSYIMAGILALMVIEGSMGMVEMQQLAAQAAAPQRFFHQLQEILPNDDRLIIGPQTYWPGLWPHNYRSFIVIPLRNNDPTLPDQTITDSLNLIQPDIIILDETILSWITSAPDPNDQLTEAQAFTAYLNQHNAQQLATLTDFTGQQVQVYRLSRIGRSEQ